MKVGFGMNILVFLLFTVLFGLTVAAQHTVNLKRGDLKAVFVDNNSFGDHHRRGYNGIAELYHKKQDSTLFVPSFSGLNLEHIFGGDSLVSLFEPRKQPMTIKKLSRSKVLLHQPVTGISQVESWTLFKMKRPHFIDVEFSFIVHNPGMFNHGYAGFFWASYINDPDQLGIYFKGRRGNNGPSDWIYAYSGQHGTNSTHIGENDKYHFFFAPDFNIALANGISDYTYAKPYYYGRFHNMVFAYLFAKPEKGVIRLSQSPNGAGDGKPAWDFHYILPDFEVGKKYTIKWSILYKEWSDQKEVENIFLNWESKN